LTDFDHTTLDPVLTGRVRLAVVGLLAGMAEAEFSFIKDQVKATDGNLGLHLRKLEDAGYITASKSFVDRKPRTTYALTDLGRDALLAYVARLEALLGGRAGPG
jgi:DNA-binding PadR family transcriptional regulator